MTVASSNIKTKFFDYVFGSDETAQTAFVCIATSKISSGYFRQRFFEWPAARDRIAAYISAHAKDKDIYFCVSLLNQEERKKEYCLGGSLIWADLDEADIENLDPPPSCVIESSPGRFQAYWRLDKNLPPDVREDFARKVTYANSGDTGTWDLTRLLRVPTTSNFKYDPPAEVKVIKAYESLVPVSLFEELPEPRPSENNGHDANNGTVPVPDTNSLPEVTHILYAYKNELRKVEDFPSLFATEPPKNADWSRIMWRLIKVCFEAGMEKEEAFAIALASKCNKYERDNRPISYLWREILKVYEIEEHEFFVGFPDESLVMPQLVDPDSVEEDSLIKEYKEWGEKATDAPHQYHELSCFIALSSFVSGGLYLPTSFTEAFIPNLWGMVLGESTLTRKTTAMRMAMDIVHDLDNEAIIASDGSVEGLLMSLSQRPNRVSLFYRDEVSGLFDSINRKDYLAGMAEFFTQLYDVPKVLPRVLKKETITVHSPYFIFFGGGIRDKVYANLSEDYVLSGFIPRFLVVSGENDLSRVRRTGPPTAISSSLRQQVINRMVEIKQQYNLKAQIEVAGQQMLRPIRIEAKLDDDAWEFFGDLEEKLVSTAAASPQSMIALPTFQRLAFSILKMGLLVASSRREPNMDSRVLVVTKDDIGQAAFYVQEWGKHTVDLITNVGKPSIEKMLDKVLGYIKVNQGMPKSTLMQRFHLNARETKDILETLQERGLIDVKKVHKGHRLYTVVP